MSKEQALPLREENSSSPPQASKIISHQVFAHFCHVLPKLIEPTFLHCSSATDVTACDK